MKKKKKPIHKVHIFNIPEFELYVIKIIKIY